MEDIEFFIGAIVVFIYMTIDNFIYDVRMRKKHGQCERCGLPNYHSIL